MNQLKNYRKYVEELLEQVFKQSIAAGNGSHAQLNRTRFHSQQMFFSMSWDCIS